MKRISIIAVAMGIVAVSSVALAFEEQKMPGGQGAAAGKQSAPSAQPSTSLAEPGLQVPKLDSGTKIRVPGLGVIGEIPKMDFGLELLYGASQPKGGAVGDRNEANGVMGRVTVPLKSR